MGSPTNLKIFIQIIILSLILLPFQNCGGPFTPANMTEQSSNINGPLNPFNIDLSVLSPMSGANVQSSLAIRGVCTSNFPVLISIDSQQSQTSTSCANGSYSVDLSLDQTDGSHTLYISQVHPSGASASKQVIFIKDTTAPVVQFTQPAASAQLTSQALNVSGNCEAGLNVLIGGSALSAPSQVACVNGTFQSPVSLIAVNGAYHLTLKQTDAAGNVGSASRPVQVNIASGTPSIKITAPAANSATKNSVSLVGTCVTGLIVRIAGTGAQSPTQISCLSGAFSSGVVLSSGDGVKNIIVEQTNAQNQTGQDSRSFILDSTAPQISIASPAAGTKATSSITLAGNCETGLGISIGGSGVAANTAVACNSGTYQEVINFSSGIGPKVITVSQTDSVGNTGTASRTFERIDLILDGSVLYATHCAACHGPLTNSAKLGRTATQISNAISTTSAMTGLDFLTSTQVSAIADALKLEAAVPPFACTAPNDIEGNLVESHARRLTTRQIRNTVSDLVGRLLGANAATAIVNAALASNSLPVDSAPRYKRFDNNFSSNHAQSYFHFADNIAKAISSTTYFGAFFTAAINLNKGNCPTLSTTSPSVECQTELIRNLGLRFLRRPLMETTALNEVEDYRREFASTSSATALGNLVFRMLLAPHFLFHLETNELAYPGHNDILKLSSISVANRLSYTFWNAPPDETLLNMAQTSDLSADAGFQSALNYVTGKTSFQDSVKEFFNDWLNLDHVPHFQSNNPAAFALFSGNAVYNEVLRSEIVNEAQELGSHVATSGGTFKDIFTTQISFARGELMKVYGTTQAAPTQITSSNAVMLPSGRHPGILTRLAWTVTSAAGNKNPVMRGARIRKEILCMVTAPPPPTLPPDSLVTPPFDSSLTVRERYHIKTSVSACSSCHSVMNPLGFALSNFNGLGRFELQEPAFNADGSYANKQLSVDASADLSPILGSGAVVSNPVQFASVIADRQETKTCFTQEFAKYFLGRDPATGEGCRMNKMYSNIIQSKSLKEFMRSLALDPDFRLRKLAP